METKHEIDRMLDGNIREIEAFDTLPALDEQELDDLKRTSEDAKIRANTIAQALEDGYISRPNRFYVITTTQTPNARGCAELATKKVYTAGTYARKAISSPAGDRAFGSHYLVGKAMPPY